MYRNRIKYWAKTKGREHQYLAKLVKVSPQTFSRWIRQESQPSITQGAILANEMGLSLDDLVEKIEEDQQHEQL